jgi:hypothetical protein
VSSEEYWDPVSFVVECLMIWVVIVLYEYGGSWIIMNERYFIED